MLREHTFASGVVAINYAEGPPSGPALVFLHGGSGRWQAYEDVLHDYAARFHLYAPSFRGHGGSGRVPGCYRFQDYTDDTIAFLQRCVAEPAYVFGHSLGGMIALMVAAQYTDGVRAVVVGDAPLWNIAERSGRGRTRARTVAWRDLAGGRLSVEQIMEALADASTEVPGQDEPVTMREKYGENAPVLRWLATNLYYDDPDMLTALLDDYDATTAGYEMEVVLPAIRCPVLLLQADPDAGGVMTDAEVKRALPLLAQAGHVRLGGAGHFFFHPDRERVLRAVVEFLESV